MGLAMLKRVLIIRWLVVTATLLMLGVVTPAVADDWDDCGLDKPPDIQIPVPSVSRSA